MAELDELEEEGEILEYDEDDILEDCDSDDNEMLISLDPSTHNLPVLSPLSKEEDSNHLNTIIHHEDDDLTERSHKLERERRTLLDQLASLKESSIYTEHALVHDTSAQVLELSDKHEREMKQLKREINQVHLERESAENENVYLKTKIEIIEEEKELLSQELVHSQEMLQLKVKELQEKTIECDSYTAQLGKYERQVANLKRQLVENDEDRRLITASKQQLMTYQELEQSHRHLSEENKILRERTDKSDLLSYQLQSLREKVSQLEREQEKCQQLQAENQFLQEKLEVFVVGESGEANVSSPLMSPTLMRLQLIHLQQKEVVLMAECSDLKTKLQIHDKSLFASKDEIEKLKKETERQKTEIESKLNTIRKLERKVRFITKERDGVVNVLSSYKLDKGADSVLKEQVTELEASNGRLRNQILQQAKELEQLHVQLELDKTTKLTQES